MCKFLLYICLSVCITKKRPNWCIGVFLYHLRFIVNLNCIVQIYSFLLENSVPNKFQTKYIFQQYMNPPGYSGIKNSNPQGMGNLSTDKSRIDRLVEDMWRERNAGKGSVLSETTQMLKPFVPNFEDQ